VGARPNGEQGKDAGLGVIHLLAVVLNAPTWEYGGEEKRRRVEKKPIFVGDASILGAKQPGF